MIIPKDTSYTFLASFGTTATGKTVQYRILSDSLTVLENYTSSGIVELGNGEYGLTRTFSTLFTGYIQFKNVTDDVVIADPITITEDFISKIVSIFKVETGRWKIVGSQFIFYDDDNITPLYTFNLKDENGSETNENPFERTPA